MTYCNHKRAPCEHYCETNDRCYVVSEETRAPLPQAEDVMRQALEALEGEENLRSMGQSPDVHWESLRDARRRGIAKTAAAISALRAEIGKAKP